MSSRTGSDAKSKCTSWTPCAPGSSAGIPSPLGWKTAYWRTPAGTMLSSCHKDEAFTCMSGIGSRTQQLPPRSARPGQLRLSQQGLVPWPRPWIRRDVLGEEICFQQDAGAEAFASIASLPSRKLHSFVPCGKILASAT